jgi:hypothetical protein
VSPPRQRLRQRILNDLLSTPYVIPHSPYSPNHPAKRSCKIGWVIHD